MNNQKLEVNAVYDVYEEYRKKSIEIITMVCEVAARLSYKFPDDSYARILAVEAIYELTGEKYSKVHISRNLSLGIFSHNALFFICLYMMMDIEPLSSIKYNLFTEIFEENAREIYFNQSKGYNRIYLPKYESPKLLTVQSLNY